MNRRGQTGQSRLDCLEPKVKEVAIVRRARGSRRSWHTRIGAGAVAALALMASSGAFAAADDRVIRFFDGSTSTEPWIQVDHFMPGDATSADLTLENTSSESARITLTASAVEDYENGCLEPETSSGDLTCADTDGEASAAFRVSVVQATDGPGRSLLWSGPVSALGDDVDLGRLEAGESMPLRIEVSLPAATGNETMTDGLAFSLAWSAQTDAPSDDEDEDGGHDEDDDGDDRDEDGDDHDNEDGAGKDLDGEDGNDDEVLGTEAEDRDGTGDRSTVTQDVDIAGVEADLSGSDLPDTGAAFDVWLLAFGATALTSGALLMLVGRRASRRAARLA
jgi:LPXTG-motif cell wall-anchored protein